MWIVTALLVAGGASVAADVPPSAPAADAAPRSAAISIALPADAGRPVSIAFGEGRISLELPRGSVLPVDFQRESNGLLRSAEIIAVGDDRIRVDLRMASGIVEGVDVGDTTVTLKLRRRFSENSGSVGRDADYQLGPDDKILIAINGDPKLSQTVVIGTDGRATFPLVGDVVVGGMTLREATERVTDLLANDYLVDPKVDLQIVDFKSQWVMVTGEVGKPGRVALHGGATLKDVLADADGMTLTAGDEIVISRDAPDGKGKVQIPIDRGAFERAEVNPPLGTGDIVNVASRPYVYVQGEVRQPGKVALERGMTLMKAIAIAGSLTEWASEKGVQIISEGSGKSKRMFNLKDIRDLKIADPVLKGGDVIFVKRRFL
jgi:polysaccharide export outer membrane protein